MYIIRDFSIENNASPLQHHVTKPKQMAWHLFRIGKNLERAADKLGCLNMGLPDKNKEIVNSSKARQIFKLISSGKYGYAFAEMQPKIGGQYLIDDYPMEVKPEHAIGLGYSTIDVLHKGKPLIQTIMLKSAKISITRSAATLILVLSVPATYALRDVLPSDVPILGWLKNAYDFIATSGYENWLKFTATALLVIAMSRLGMKLNMNFLTDKLYTARNALSEILRVAKEDGWLSLR
jgi:hypothetical protein